MTIYTKFMEELNHKQYFEENEVKTLLHGYGLECGDMYDEDRHNRQLLCAVLDVLEGLQNDIDMFRIFETGFSTIKDAYEYLEHKIQQTIQRVRAIDLENLYKQCNDKNVRNISVGNLNFEVKRRLSISDVKTVVGNVCNNVAGSEFGPEFSFYNPELKDYLLRVEVLKAYTNLTLPAAENSECWDLVYGTPIFAMITGHEGHPVTFNGQEYDDGRFIDTEQYEKIVDAIDKKIDYITMRSYAGGER